MNRRDNLSRLDGKHFHVLVIGGGITGAGIAWDCALRGLSVALLERTDFAAGTSGASSKMVHAGLRYMANDPQLVREAALERQRMYRACAHLARPLEYYLPVYADTPEYKAETISAILRGYDELGGGALTKAHRVLDPAQVLLEITRLRRPLAVGSYWDGIMDDARVTLEVIRAAVAAGAAAVNHAEVAGFIEDRSGQVKGVRFYDNAPGAGGASMEVTADAVVSASGVYTDLVLNLAGEGTRPPILRPSKGMHLVFRSTATGGKALVIPIGGNVLYFLVPFLHEYLIMGCTDTDYAVHSYADLDFIPVLEQEIQYNLGLLDRVLPEVFSRKDIIACYAGVRPLVRPPEASSRPSSTSDTSRSHRIWKEENGLWVIAGGKFTTFRLMAEQVVDRIAEDLCRRGIIKQVTPCSTAERRYHGAPPSWEFPDGIGGWLAQKSAAVRKVTGMPEDCSLHLAETFGAEADRVTDLIRSQPALGERIGEGRPWVMAEIRHAVEQEMCLTLTDFLARRSALRFAEHQGLDVAEKVAAHMGKLLGWDAATGRQQVQDYRGFIRRTWPGELD